MTKQEFKDYPALLARLRASRDAAANKKEADEAPQREHAAFIRARAVAFVESSEYEVIERVASNPPAVTSAEAPSPVDDLAYAAGYVVDPEIYNSTEIDRFVETVFAKDYRLTEVDAVAFAQAVAELFSTIRMDLVSSDILGEN